jgi:hypothetical protein
MGLISLCHPDSKKSCGACCGLYNYEDNSRETLSRLMHERTDVFRSKIKDGVDVGRIKDHLEDIKTPKKLFDVIYNCPFIGFVDEGRRRVGCMIHPINNNGVEMRDVSFYGAKLCNDHECPSFTYLSETEKRGVSSVIDDWYLYGLVITDIDFVKEYFRILAEALGEEIKPERLMISEVKKAAYDFFGLKESWPFKSRKKRFGKYSFSIAEYRIEKEVGERELRLPESRYKKIFISLETDFPNEGEAKRGEGMIDSLISDFISAYGDVAQSYIDNDTVFSKRETKAV